MKLTWFGGTTVRIHIGGAILVSDSAQAPEGVDRAELEAGAERLFSLRAGDLERVDLARWLPRRRAAAFEEEGPRLMLLGGGEGLVLADAPGEPPLLLADAEVPPLGRWANDAVIVLFGEASTLEERGKALLEAEAPRLVVLAGEGEAAFAALRGHLRGTGLIVPEPGLAIEA